jgi:hypothetical protein
MKWLIRQNYRFLADETDHASPERSRHWNKVKSALSVISSSKAPVFWLDADAIFSNFEFKIDSLVEQARDAGADLVICRDLSIPKVRRDMLFAIHMLQKAKSSHPMYCTGAKHMRADLSEYGLIPPAQYALVHEHDCKSTIIPPNT